LVQMKFCLCINEMFRILKWNPAQKY
jgi:hypothetical protein